MIIVIMIVSGAVFGGGSAILAANKNRSAFSWFVLGFFFSFVALIVIAGLSPVPEVRQGRNAKRSSPSTNAKRVSQSDNLDWKNGSEFTSKPQDPERPWLG
ncbi:hypothetical protein [Brucella gallinifaecis]|uniref:hypothetical protein n=1 Tax=Brucella gallinifaecis TaxID=215590 RepID=UPI002360D8A8|nr:hypothetical protein [Brucella gallinifaecis]